MQLQVSEEGEGGPSQMASIFLCEIGGRVA